MHRDELVKVLENVGIFKDMTADCIKTAIDTTKYTVKNYDKQEIIGIEGDECQCLAIVLSGNLEVRKEFPAGHAMTLTYLEAGDTFGEVIVFSQETRYPATIEAMSKAEVLFINTDDMLDLMERCYSVTRNFLNILSNKILVLNRKTSILAFKTIDEKIASFLLDLYKRQKSETLMVPMSRKEMADFLNVPRPSLSRSMADMKARGLIDYYLNTVKILDAEGLEACLF